jgi:serine/threonine-protein kinase
MVGASVRNAVTDVEPDAGPTFNEGDLLAGRFRLGRSLGGGGMGVVMAATHVDLGGQVALKFLRSYSDKGEVERFMREARAAGRLRSEHVTRVFDVGRLESGMPFIVMEYLEGETLREVLRKRPVLPVQEVVGYALQVCKALADAHAHGIVHRDLKPANLFLTRDLQGQALIKVFDFGISKILAEEDPGLTTTGRILGSPSYLSPEQLIAPRTVDARTDVWAMGVTLYQLLAGTLPFDSDNPVKLYMLVLNSTPVPVQEHRPDLPHALADVIARCMQKDPANRFANIAELAYALEPFAPPAMRGATKGVANALGAPYPPLAPAPSTPEASLPADDSGTSIADTTRLSLSAPAVVPRKAHWWSAVIVAMGFACAALFVPNPRTVAPARAPLDASATPARSPTPVALPESAVRADQSPQMTVPAEPSPATGVPRNATPLTTPKREPPRRDPRSYR